MIFQKFKINYAVVFKDSPTIYEEDYILSTDIDINMENLQCRVLSIALKHFLYGILNEKYHKTFNDIEEFDFYKFEYIGEDR